MVRGTVLLALVAQSVAFPFVADAPGINKRLLQESNHSMKKRSTDTCPFNPDHQPAVPITQQYPYLGALGGNKSTGAGGILVPAPGDTAHYFQAPGPNDIRGPCPGLNTLANHGFLARDGITTYNELVDAQQNVYNIGWNLANLLATFGVGLDGDLVTGKLSIGCSADERTNAAPGVLGTETGLNGHNKFEADASLTRNDYFLADGDDYSLNTTLFQRMADVSQNNFNRQNLGLYRYQRYQESRATNPNFFFSPGSLLLYGAATFLYKAFPDYGGAGQPTLDIQKSFFGVGGDSGSFTSTNNERLPDKWHNNRSPYDMGSIGQELFSMYALYPVQFGGNVGQAGNFNAMNYSTYISGGFFQESTPKSMMCMIYQLATVGFPTSLSAVYQIPADSLALVLGKLEPGYKDLGCPSPLFPTKTPITGGVVGSGGSGGSSSSSSSSS